jgi:hypothetical protein
MGVVGDFDGTIFIIEEFGKWIGNKYALMDFWVGEWNLSTPIWVKKTIGDGKTSFWDKNNTSHLWPMDMPGGGGMANKHIGRQLASPKRHWARRRLAD